VRPVAIVAYLVEEDEARDTLHSKVIGQFGFERALAEGDGEPRLLPEVLPELLL
jgi:hypothetical protein